MSSYSPFDGRYIVNGWVEKYKEGGGRFYTCPHCGYEEGTGHHETCQRYVPRTIDSGEKKPPLTKPKPGEL